MAIQQHPLPQDISSYRFRLIGDMTIKQFAFLAGFIIVGVIFYSSPLPFFFKYPLAGIAVMLGIGIAFVPVQGRPLDQWIVAFIKSIYSPTQYIWRQSKIEETTPGQTPANPLISSASTPPSATQTTNIYVPTPISSPTVSPIAPVTPPSTQSEPTPTNINEPVQTSSSEPIPQTPKQPFTQVIAPLAPEPTQAPTSLPTPSAVISASPNTPAPSISLPIPFTPTTPNTLVGLTLNNEGKILDGVMVEIQSKGLTIRATRSNRLGQFMFARPLENGLYQILAEKENFKFAAYSLELKGDIVKPLKIQAET